MTVVVVGAGVIGLTCAVRLAEAGHRVRVITRKPPLGTTSAVAAAVWFPYRVEPPDRVDGWAARSYQVLADLATSSPESGVVMRELVSLGRAAKPDPSWRQAVAGFGRLRSDELPPGYRDGWRASVPVAETPRYLPWLAARLERADGVVEVRPAGVPSLAAAAEGASLVVHCSGLGARTLAGDAGVVPVRGQVVWGESRPRPRGSRRGRPGRADLRHSRRDDCLLGGTAEPGEESMTPDPAATAAIRAAP